MLSCLNNMFTRDRSVVMFKKRHHWCGHSFKCAGWLKSEIKKNPIFKCINSENHNGSGI